MPQVTAFVNKEYHPKWLQIKQHAAFIRWALDNCPHEFKNKNEKNQVRTFK